MTKKKSYKIRWQESLVFDNGLFRVCADVFVVTPQEGYRPLDGPGYLYASMRKGNKVTQEGLQQN